MSEFVDVSVREPPGPRRRPAVLAAAALLVVLVVVGVVVLVVQPGDDGPGPVAAPVTAPPSPAAPATTTRPEGSVSPTTAVGGTTPTASPGGPGPCTPDAIAAGLGRAVTDLVWCEDGWAYVDIGNGLGDGSVLVRLVGNDWVRYTGFPSTVCQARAAADGVPPRGLPNFDAPCSSQTTTAPDLEDGALLGVGVPITQPACDGSGIVVLGSAVTPGRYVEDVAAFLVRFPGSSYLRTDRSCPSLRQATDSGDPIYAVFRPVGASTSAAICSAVASAGGDAYGKRLDATSDPTQPVIC